MHTLKQNWKDIMNREDYNVQWKTQQKKLKQIQTYSGVCVGEKSSPFSDITQNSTLEKRTPHKI